ncbi:MAG: hypothetical protein Ct9H90mP11_05980 [Acidimicrobiales bacterium]|nr:MAG: hypothetical protein Ct9H90mP11_05980 [Acidimicrobiales bacterium]
MGLTRRRHFASRGKKLLGNLKMNFLAKTSLMIRRPLFKGRMTLAATMEQARTGRLGDIIATFKGNKMKS